MALIQFEQLELDMKQLLDEREELVNERDTYKTKHSRLNDEMNYIMRGDDKHVIDIDSLIVENRFLQQKVKQLQEQNAISVSTINKYRVSVCFLFCAPEINLGLGIIGIISVIDSHKNKVKSLITI